MQKGDFIKKNVCHNKGSKKSLLQNNNLNIGVFMNRSLNVKKIM